MQPKNLLPPFYFKDRKVFFEKGVLYVPSYYTNYQEFKLDLQHYFQNANPICIEYCSGNGHWIIEQARKNPNINYIAVEKKFERVRKIWSKKENNHIKNLLIVCGFALDFTKHFLKNASIEKIWVHFPDPYPKQRHRKHRLFNEAFVLDMKRVLKGKCEVIVVTDDKNYSHHFVQVMQENGFYSLYDDPFYKKDLPYDFSQFLFFWQNEGKTIYHFKFQKESL